MSYNSTQLYYDKNHNCLKYIDSSNGYFYFQDIQTGNIRPYRKWELLSNKQLPCRKRKAPTNDFKNNIYLPRNRNKIKHDDVDLFIWVIEEIQNTTQQ